MTRFTPQWLQQGSYAASVDRRLMSALWPAPASSGCAVTVQAGMNVNVAAGQVAIPCQNNTGSVLCTSDAVELVALAAAPAAGNNRIDLIVAQARGNDLDGGTNNDFIFTAVTGTAAASPVAPAVPANALALAQILVPGGSAAVTAGNITDLRPGNLAIPTRASLGGFLMGRNWSTTDVGVFPSTGNLLAVTWTAVAGHKYWMHADCQYGVSTGNGGGAQFLRLDGTDVAIRNFSWGIGGSTQGPTCVTSGYTAPAAGSRTVAILATSSASGLFWQEGELIVIDLGP